MKENEAIQELESRISPYDTCKADFDANEAIKTAIKALEEIQQYRAIGTVEELITAMKYVRLAKAHRTVGKAIEECAKYEEIGTPEECRAAVEKQTETLTVDKAKTIAAKAICIGCGYLTDCKCDYNGSNCMVSKPMLESVLKSFDDWGRRANDETD